MNAFENSMFSLNYKLDAAWCRLSKNKTKNLDRSDLNSFPLDVKDYLFPILLCLTFWQKLISGAFPVGKKKISLNVGSIENCLIHLVAISRFSFEFPFILLNCLLHVSANSRLRSEFIFILSKFRPLCFVFFSDDHSLGVLLPWNACSLVYMYTLCSVHLNHCSCLLP